LLQPLSIITSKYTNATIAVIFVCFFMFIDLLVIVYTFKQTTGYAVLFRFWIQANEENFRQVRRTLDFLAVSMPVTVQTADAS
jgi:uncharacterized membrane protein